MTNIFHFVLLTYFTIMEAPTVVETSGLLFNLFIGQDFKLAETCRTFKIGGKNYCFVCN